MLAFFCSVFLVKCPLLLNYEGTDFAVISRARKSQSRKDGTGKKMETIHSMSAID